jgi:hypothetical protein
MTAGSERPACVLLLALSSFVSAQQPARAQRTATAPAGSARIAGVVVDTSTPPQPLRRVLVTLQGAGLPDGRTTISDDEGRFAFDALPAGRFTLAGTRPAFLPGSYGSVRPGRPGVPLQVASGQRLDVRLTLARGAALMGTLRDEGGEAASNLPVYAFRVPLPGAPPILQLTGSATTDDRGVYRIFGLPPADYVVASAIRMSHASDIGARSAPEIDAILRELRSRASGATTTTPTGAPAVHTPPATYAYAPVFYPGVASAGAADRVRLAVGEERTGIDFAIRLTRMATIEGVVRAADGSTPAPQFVINPEGLQLRSLIGAVPTFSSQATASGRAFKYTNVAPGRYRLAVQSTQGGVTFASTDVEVAGADVDGITLVLQPAFRMTGRVVFDATTLTPPDVGSARVTIVSTNGLGSSSSGSTRMGNFPVPAATAGADGRFELSGIVPDAYRLNATVGGPRGWWLRSAIVNGVDVLDHPLDITGSVSDVVVTFSDRETTLSGRLMTGAGTGAPAYFVVVFPADRALWRPGARRIKLVRADTDGAWIVRQLPAGDYLIAALTDVDEADLLETSFLDALAPSAVRIALADGEDKRQDLRIGR